VTKIQVDFKGIETYEALPRGRYPVVIESVTVRESETSEYPYLNWELRVDGGEFEGRHLFLMTSLSPKALWRLRGILEALGVFEETMEFEVDDSTSELVSPDLIGIEAEATVSVEKYEGQLRNRVENLYLRTKASEKMTSPKTPNREPVKEPVKRVESRRPLFK